MNRSIPPKVHSFGQLRLSSPRVISLHNGLRIYIETGSEVDVNRLTIALPGGIAEEPVAGLASCTASMLAEGTNHYSGADIAARLEYAGAWTGTSVSTHYTSITLSSLNEKFGELLPILIDIVFHPTFPQEAANGILRKQAAKTDIDRRKVTFLADEAIRPLVYGAGSPLSRTESSPQILSLTTENLRKFHYSRLATSDIHVFLSGNITDKIESLVTDAFSRIASGTNYRLAPLSFAPAAESPREVHVELPGSQQSAVKMMIPAPGRLDPDFVPLRAAVTALGGYFGSRLMLNIREARGLTYGISAALLGYPEQSFITISTQTACDSVSEVRKLVLEEIERMKDPASYTEDELMRLSRFLLSGLAAILDTPFSRMEFFKTRLYADTPDNYFELQENFARRLDPTNTDPKEAAQTLASIAEANFRISRRVTAIAGQ